MTRNQPFCVACWNRDHPDRPIDDAQAGPLERCATCAAETRSGIYVRVDPATVPFPKENQDVTTLTDEDRRWLDPGTWAKIRKPRYEVQADGRVMFKIMLTAGDVAYAVTPWHTADKPMQLSAAAIAADCALPVAEVSGREYYATGDAEGLADFALVFDPRL